ncbi:MULTISPECIES: hypothetical protein [Legionella]|uniref:Uncharacterized protein n=1 Tax=Legionella waltersii TaxID=66969 RepID=A0A0W1AC14_9GAMM|nr:MULTISPECIES: hypothetical protein [Legionella]KTD78886.1 hypothetical protein Lwal_1656 [Legionella waltersii]MCZ4798246.1 hypothetical protein [Legionella pneumophila]SNU96510.1 Uncharacterised protein [Legionella waltersii]
MMHLSRTINRWALSASLALVNLSYAPALWADSGWFPKVAASDDMTQGNKSAMTVLSNVVRQGLMILLFIVSVVMFTKFISTISHGIEEAKKHEGGSLAVFANFAVMGIVYLTISIATGYLGYTVIDKFKL